VILSNTGTATLTVSSITITTNFTRATTCSSLKPGATCKINVRFKPTAAGNIAGTLTINDNASNSPQIVTLSGTGT